MQWLIDIVLENFKGMILMWSGAVSQIPNGWHLCDGTEGTPNLQDKFIVGAGDSYDPDETGGTDQQTHDFTGDGHTHAIFTGTGIETGTGKKATTEATAAIGTTDEADNRPQYYALCYIMKL